MVFLVQLINLHPNVDQALRVLKKKLQREGLFRELKRRKAYEKPSERRAWEKGEAIRRGRKAARKLAQRELQVRASNGPVCTENLHPDVVVMKSAKDRV